MNCLYFAIFYLSSLMTGPDLISDLDFLLTHLHFNLALVVWIGNLVFADFFFPPAIC